MYGYQHLELIGIAEPNPDLLGAPPGHRACDQVELGRLRQYALHGQSQIELIAAPSAAEGTTQVGLRVADDEYWGCLCLVVPLGEGLALLLKSLRFIEDKETAKAGCWRKRPPGVRFPVWPVPSPARRTLGNCTGRLAALQQFENRCLRLLHLLCRYQLTCYSIVTLDHRFQVHRQETALVHDELTIDD